MAVDYEVACREGDLGALLTASFLLSEGARVLLLPPLAESMPEPTFLLPVVRGYPAGLLSEFIKLEPPEAAFFSWQSGSEIQCWPGFAGSDGDFSESEIVASNLTPKLWQQLDELWQLIDGCMARNLDMPATSISGFWQMFLLLVQSELLRESRRHTLKTWLDAAGIAFAEQHKWHSLIPLISLYRFSELPLLAFAYGVKTLLDPAAIVDIELLKRSLYEHLLANGAHQATEDWSPVFDGKWFIGVGSDNMVACRSTVYLADSHPDRLRQEIPVVNQRRDFKRQLLFDKPGLRHLHASSTGSTQFEKPHSLYHLNCSESESLSGSEFFAPASVSGSKNGKAQTVVRHNWVDVGDEKDLYRGDLWGWQPHLPAMMGGGFLPLTGSFCRFYRVGWHNLPGFGLGGLVYSARQAASAVLRNELS